MRPTERPSIRNQHRGGGDDGNNLDTPWKSAKIIEVDGDTERHPFLGSSTSSTTVPSSGPVRLTPGWEDSTPPFDDILQSSTINLSHPPKDRFIKKLSGFSTPLLTNSENGGVELVENSENVKNFAKYNADRRLRPLVKVPQDRWNLVYLILVVHGIGVLMPWNMFINAKDYFEKFKFGEEYLGNSDGTYYAERFVSYLLFASQLPNVFFSWLNLLVPIGGSPKTRIVCAIVVEAILFVFTVVLAMVDTRDTPGLFFWLTMGSCVLINTAGGIYQNSIFGIASKLNYAGAVVLGSNISGTFTAVVNIGAIWLANQDKHATKPKPTAAIYYFITALLVLLVCFDTYFALPLNKFFRYHELRSAKEAEKRSHPHSQIGMIPRVPYLTILRKCFPQCLNAFMVFFVTLAIFPAVQSNVKMNDGIMEEKFFSAVACFLVFNVFAMLGSLLPLLFVWPGPRWLWIPIVLRFALIPFFYLCNFEPQNMHRVPESVLITNDWVFIAGGVVLGLTGGYYSSLAMMYCPRNVESQYAPVAGMFGAAFLITGIFAGVMTSFVAPEIVKLLNTVTM